MQMMPSPRIAFDWEERRRWLELPMPVAEFERRASQLQEAMAREGFDALVVYGGSTTSTTSAISRTSRRGGATPS